MSATRTIEALERDAPDLSCARISVARAQRRHPIDIAWEDSTRFRVAAGAAIEREVALGGSLTTRLLNAAGRTIPERTRQRRGMLRLMSLAARATLGTGRLNLTGLTPNGHRFIASSRRMWLIESSRAVVDGVDVGTPGPLANQTSLGDLILPQRGLFVAACARLEQLRNRGGAREPRRIVHRRGVRCCRAVP